MQEVALSSLSNPVKIIILINVKRSFKKQTFYGKFSAKWNRVDYLNEETLCTVALIIQICRPICKFSP